MTVPTTTQQNTYTADGTLAVYPYTFRILQASDIVVTALLAGTHYNYVLGVDYTVSGVGSYTGGNVTFTAGNAPAGTFIVFRRDAAEVQTLSLQDGSAFFAQSVESALDLLTMCVLTLRLMLTRTFLLPETSTPTGLVLPEVAGRSNGLLGFDGSGNVVITSSTPVTAAAAAAAASASAAATSATAAAASAGSVAARIDVMWFQVISSQATNVTIASPGATIGGITMVAGQAIMLVGQTIGSQNGPWTWNGAAVPLTRPANYASGAPVATTYGIMAVVIDGGVFYVCTTTGTITVDTTATAWTNPFVAPAITTGTFVATDSVRFSPPLSLTIAWTKIGDVVTLVIPAGQQTSTVGGSFWTLSGVPAGLIPPSVGQTMLCLCEDNGGGVPLLTFANVNTAGGIDFQLASGNNWTAANLKGPRWAFTITYKLV